MPDGVRSAAVVVRLYNDREWFPKALRSIFTQKYRPLTVCLVYDLGSTDGTLAEARDTFSRDAPPDIAGTHITIPHTTPWEAFRKALEVTTADYIFDCDADNELAPDGVAQRIALHPNGIDGVCAGKVDMFSGDIFIESLPRSATVEYEALKRRNEYDGLCLMLGGKWARERLLPAMREADIHHPGEKIEDMFAVLLAAKDGKLHFHDIDAGRYHFRPDALSRRRAAATPTMITILAVEALNTRPSLY